ncbi:HAD-like protein [Auricularia subglabra TFB-10046 SS5]|uniref:HAD-like protein n=1 Tax=Auricularia subglabra (strain TFB-10046 / SS5) TaxID=717982 RepID=J0D026_AURST|nr:HAD-like protein [Auricularia subglabra TFB-10046 SS5]
MGSYLDFEEVTRRSLAQAAPTLSAEKRNKVMEAYAHLETFKDVGSGLRALAQQGKADLVIFTNGTRAMVEGAVSGSPSLSPFAKNLLPAVVVDDPGLKHYKPSPAAYNFVSSTYARDASNGNLWLVSSNPFDVAGARSAGWNAVWVDRAGAGWSDGLGTPSTIVRDFGQLEAALGLE